MGIIARAYSPLFVNGQIIYASNVARALDDIYGEVNGNLDSANLKHGFVLDQSTVAISNQTYTATDVIGAFTELKLKGFNTVHAAGFGTNGISIFPGIVENRGMFCRVNSRINLTASLTISSGTTFGSGTRYALMFKRVQTVTASDVYITDIENLSASLGINSSYNGYYDTASQDRAITSFYQGYSASMNLYDLEMYQKPFLNSVYGLSANEICASNFVNTYVTSVHRIFDFNTNMYYYRAGGSLATTTGCSINLFTDINEFSVFSSAFVGQTGAGFPIFFMKDFTVSASGIYSKTFIADNNTTYDGLGNTVMIRTFKGNNFDITFYVSAVSGSKYKYSLYRNPLFNRILI